MQGCLLDDDTGFTGSEAEIAVDTVLERGLPVEEIEVDNNCDDCTHPQKLMESLMARCVDRGPYEARGERCGQSLWGDFGSSDFEPAIRGCTGTCAGHCTLWCVSASSLNGPDSMLPTVGVVESVLVTLNAEVITVVVLDTTSSVTIAVSSVIVSVFE